jgi:hypothetical protein
MRPADEKSQTTINDITVMFIGMVDDPNHHARAQSQGDKRDYADLTGPEQPNVLRTPTALFRWRTHRS